MMNDIRTLLIQLQQRGIKLVLDGDNLKSRSAPGAIDAAAAATIREHKTQIVQYLQQHQAMPTQEVQHELAPVARNQPLPLSFSQRRLWFVDQIDGSLQYIIQFSQELMGKFDATAFQAALAHIVQRHEALRTVFVQHDAEVVQQVLEAALPDYAVLDLQQLDASAQEQEIARQRALLASTPFDLQRDVMLRARLLQLSAQHHIAHFAVHHIAADGWAIDIFIQELLSLYASYSQGQTPNLPALPIQYADFACWQQQQASAPLAARHLQYWQSRLDGVAHLHSLPLDFPRPLQKNIRAARLTHLLPAELTQTLHQLARSHDATLFMLIHSALSLLLTQWSRHNEIVIGTPIAGRSQQKTAGLIGFFANTLALRMQLDGARSFLDVLKLGRQCCLEAYEHQDIAFDKIVEVLQPERSASYTPLFQIMLTMAAYSRKEISVDGLAVRSLPAQQVQSSFDLDIALTESTQGLHIQWDFDPALFASSTMQRMLDGFNLLLNTLAKDGDCQLAELSLLSAAEHDLLARWNHSAQAFPHDACLHQLIEQQAARTPDKIALIEQQGQEVYQLSYQQLNAKANALALQLQAQGIKMAQVVPVIMPAGCEVPLSFLAIMKAGAVFAPLDINWPLDRLNATLATLASPLVLVKDATIAGLTPTLQQIIVDADQLTSAENVALTMDASMPIYVVHTSGSTGLPKGALNQHRGIVNRLAFMSRYFNDQEDEVVLQTTHHCFDSAVWQFFWPLIKGGTTVLPALREHFDLQHIVNLLQQHRVTITDFTPALLSLFAEHMLALQSTSAPAQSSLALRDLIVGGEDLSLAIARLSQQALPQVKLHNFYGASEASIGSMYYTLSSAATTTNASNTSIPIGRPIDNVVISIVNQDLQAVPIGAAGEILMGGLCVGLGYVGNSAQTAQSFIDLPSPRFGCSRFYRTGDLARYRADGEVEYLGRIDAQVKVRGFRIELAEIQAALEAQAGIAQAFVRVTGEASNKKIVAYLVAQRDTAHSETELVASVKAGVTQRLPQYMLPAAYVCLAELPLSPSGKVNQRALPEAPQATQHDYIAPQSPIEKSLAAIWSELFHLPQVGMQDDFFALGGHSLLATQLVARVRKQMHIELPLRVLFASSSLRDLSMWCVQQMSRQEPSSPRHFAPAAQSLSEQEQ